MKRYLLVVLVLMRICTVHGQSFVMTTDTKKIVQNSSFNVQYTLNGAKGDRFKSPDLEP